MTTPENGPPPNSADHARTLLEFLGEHRSALSPLLIMSHDFPDPDAIGSMYGLQHLVQSAFGIEARIAYSGIIGRVENQAMVRTLRIRMHRFHPVLLKRFANVALVDTQPVFGNNSFPGNRKATLVLDQHPGDTPPQAGLAIVDPGCGATCVLVAQALLQASADIPARVATALAYGILTDTLDLYRARRGDVTQTYLEVMRHADMRALARIRNPLRSRKFFSVLGRGIREAVQYRRLVVSHLGLVDAPDRVSQVAEFLLTYERAQWCFVSGRYKGRLHVSLRSVHQDAQAGEVLRNVFVQRTQAGGHGPIGGGSCRIGLDAPEEKWSERERVLTERLRGRLRIRSTTEPRKPFAS
ncbi:MAG: DHH family phosphoesterase [Verrucomicrobia bacterium]|jgi:nanoRNase/pAp phosphatase (c-di-AMP/oligoRNAs hydrolase)|nr:DHH family phosphoesterase [Verrucomicrobiota bacterium]OQC67063.1 MAG: putative manganese-dependent inorganic pyrophosphatase [Verrucomicrobia bacterium ADurb.Bin006]MDI9382093.1 DHH family phosphoesterase [Verrucomicrobiota bacterium]HOA60784.1 DHH family phosphoesterase [Verrucomicrobiota bacterium]HOF48857.1 DHH family phosphoesterase [Verrucomicrobiota bacterium]